MSQLYSIYPDNSEARLLRKAVFAIQNGGIVVYPTDSGYALGCHLGDAQALNRIRQIRQLDKHHSMTLVCANLSFIDTYAKVNQVILRLLKAYTPGSYTFILQATKEVPKKMLHPNRQTLGLRVPDHAIALGLLEALGEPLMSISLALPGINVPLSEPKAIYDLLGDKVDLIIDGGNCSCDPTTIVDLTGDFPRILREGKGDFRPFLLEDK